MNLGRHSSDTHRSEVRTGAPATLIMLEDWKAQRRCCSPATQECSLHWLWARLCILGWLNGLSHAASRACWLRPGVRDCSTTEFRANGLPLLAGEPRATLPQHCSTTRCLLHRVVRRQYVLSGKRRGIVKWETQETGDGETVSQS